MLVDLDGFCNRFLVRWFVSYFFLYSVHIVVHLTIHTSACLYERGSRPPNRLIVMLCGSCMQVHRELFIRRRICHPLTYAVVYSLHPRLNAFPPICLLFPANGYTIWVFKLAIERKSLCTEFRRRRWRRPDVERDGPTWAVHAQSPSRSVPFGWPFRQSASF